MAHSAGRHWALTQVAIMQSLLFISARERLSEPNVQSLEVCTVLFSTGGSAGGSTPGSTVGTFIRSPMYIHCSVAYLHRQVDKSTLNALCQTPPQSSWRLRAHWFVCQVNTYNFCVLVSKHGGACDDAAGATKQMQSVHWGDMVMENHLRSF